MQIQTVVSSEFVPPVCANSTDLRIESAYTCLVAGPTGREKILLASRLRPYFGQRIVELPGGGVEPDEHHATDTAFRELLEELRWEANERLSNDLNWYFAQSLMVHLATEVLFATNRPGRTDAYHLLSLIRVDGYLARDICEGFVPHPNEDEREADGFALYSAADLPQNVSITHSGWFFPCIKRHLGLT